MCHKGMANNVVRARRIERREKENLLDRTGSDQIIIARRHEIERPFKSNGRASSPATERDAEPIVFAAEMTLDRLAFDTRHGGDPGCGVRRTAPLRRPAPRHHDQGSGHGSA
jgi:hypothetical protein